MATIVITGFGPFPGAPVNPSATLVARLARVRRPALARHKLVSHVFATSYDAVDRELPGLVASHRPDAIVMFGLAARTRFVRIETRARNCVGPLHADGKQRTPRLRVIAPRAPATKPGRAPFAQLVRAARTTGIDARRSRNAGNYVCNFVYWRALEAVARPKGPRVVAFIHVPNLRGPRGGHTALPTLIQLTRAAEAIVLAALQAAERH